KILRWVRERAGLSRHDLAKDLRVDEERVEKWERTGEIGFALAERLASKTRAPIGYLYLDEPLEEALEIPDYRTVGSRGIKTLSPELIETKDEAQQRQKWYREYLAFSGAKPLPFVHSI